MQKCARQVVWKMETVALAFQRFGIRENPPMIILHGLLGSARNWNRIGKELEADYCVYAVDVRNHGASPHLESMDYAAMAEDVLRLMDQEDIDTAMLVGHSMGGKIAMTFACAHPERVHRLVVVDIAPKAYAPRWEAEFALMNRLLLETIQNRSEAEAFLEPSIKDWAFRKFLLTNLVRKPEGGFRWAVNLNLLQDSLPYLFKNPLEAGDRYDGPTQFICGAQSPFVEQDDLAQIRKHFPQAYLECIENAGHNVHFDQPEAFLHSLKKDGT